MSIEKVITKILSESTTESKKLYKDIEAYSKKNISNSSEVISLKKDSSSGDLIELDLVFSPRPRKKINVNVKFVGTIYLLTIKSNYVNNERYHSFDELMKNMVWYVVTLSNK